MSDRIYEISFNYWNSAVLMAGVKLGLFNLLYRQSLSSKKIAQQLKINPSFTQFFLETCFILGLIQKEKEQYKNSS